MNISDYSYLKEWKEKMTNIVRLKYSEDEISDKKLEKYLDSQIESNINNHKLLLVNNYTNKLSRVTTLELTEIIRKNKLICAGGGCLFLQHKIKENILIEFILHIMDSRKQAKNERKKYDKGTDEWADADRKQLAFKLIVNSLYGCLGYPGFIMFNIFLAEAITNQGRHIITTAINAIENFLGDCMYFENEAEVFNAIHNIDTEFYSRTHGHLSDDALNRFTIDFSELPRLVTDRFLQHCIFIYDEKFKNNLFEIFKKMSTDELIIMYYKNNMMEFSRLPFMKDKIKSLILKNGELSFCEDYSYKDEECLNILRDIWDFYDLFVLYDYPIFDRVQKAMYLDKSKSLYTDTDSVFVSLDEVVKFIENEVFTSPEEANMNAQDLTFTAANFTLSIVNRVIARALHTLCKSLNITDEYAKLLNMKNEMFFKRIMFQDVKKRYISLALLQEGQLLGDGKGLPEIKGFDFIKAGTKPFVKNYYTNLCLDEILYADEIKPQRIFKKVINLKRMMEETIKDGNMEFFKQANVKRPEYYKNPYSTQGVCAILLWNALCPDKALSFPTDVNIVPIKELTYPRPPKRLDSAPINRAVNKTPMDYKNIAEYANKYPESCELLFKNFYSNSNQLIRHMNLSSIAIPKNIDYELPKYITDLFDISSIITDTMSLILPIMKTVGINSFQVSSTTEYISNMINL